LDKSPVNAFEDSFLDDFLVCLECVDQELDVVFHEVDLPLLLLTKSIELEHLDKTLAGFLNDSNAKVQGKQLHTHIEVVEDVIDIFGDLLLADFNHFIELGEDLMDNI